MNVGSSEIVTEMCSFCMTVLCVKLSSTCNTATCPRITDWFTSMIGQGIVLMLPPQQTWPASCFCAFFCTAKHIEAANTVIATLLLHLSMSTSKSASCRAANFQIRLSKTKVGLRKLRSVIKIKSTSRTFVFGMLLYSDVEKVQPDWLCNHCWKSGVCQSKSEWPLTVLTSRLPEEYHREEASTKVDTSRRVNCGYKNECHEKNWTLKESVQQKTVDQSLTNERLTELATKDGHRVSWQTCTEATGSIDWNALILRVHDMKRFLSRLSNIRWNWLPSFHSIDTSTPFFSFSHTFYHHRQEVPLHWLATSQSTWLTAFSPFEKTTHLITTKCGPNRCDWVHWCFHRQWQSLMCASWHSNPVFNRGLGLVLFELIELIQRINVSSPTEQHIMVAEHVCWVVHSLGYCASGARTMLCLLAMRRWRILGWRRLRGEHRLVVSNLASRDGNADRGGSDESDRVSRKRWSTNWANDWSWSIAVRQRARSWCRMIVSTCLQAGTCKILMMVSCESSAVSVEVSVPDPWRTAHFTQILENSRFHWSSSRSSRLLALLPFIPTNTLPR